MSKHMLTVAVLVGVAMTSRAYAADAYYKVQVKSLTITQGVLPPDQGPADWRKWDLAQWMVPYAVLDQSGEAYVSMAGGADRGWRADPSVFTRDAVLLVRSSQGGDVTGRLYVAAPELAGMTMVRFRIPARAAVPAARNEFLQARESHYTTLLQREIAGSAWFRHQARAARIDRTGNAPGDDQLQQPRFDWRRREGDLADTYALFTGGRALSENLQLDRVLPPSRPGQETVDIETIEGITVRELDWASLIGDSKPSLDPLASSIPADQHVIFFPSFEAAVSVADESEAYGLPVLRVMEPQAENARTRERYERQLCVSINGLARLIGPTVIGSMALTGSDPYYRVGTDVAVVFAPKDAAKLHALLLAQITAAMGSDPAIQKFNGELAGMKYTGARNGDRSVCSYLATVGKTIVVTNSLAQLERLIDVHTGKAAAISSLPEYSFFRTRYARDGSDEAAFVFLSDATIRRWCGPRWRIATSRRTRDAAVLAELQASSLDALASGGVQAGPIQSNLPLSQVGELRMSPLGVVSSVQNTLEFMTPIAELPLEKVTMAEAEAYRQWRDRYQQNWRQYFDPIGLRLAIQDKRLAVDLTVMPLILGTEYRQAIEVGQGATIEPLAGDPHEALLHAVMAVNVDSPQMQEAAGFASMIAPRIGMNALAWLGKSVAIYADDDPVWSEWANTSDDDKERFLRENLHRLPVALHVAVKDSLKLAVFLTALRAFAEQTAPGLTAWESLTHNGQPYVRISATEEGQAEMGQVANLAVHYAAAGDALVVTLNAEVLKRALDRRAARKGGAGGKQPPATHGQGTAKPWLGSSLALRASASAFGHFAKLSGEAWQRTLRVRSWGNIPILNEWKRRYPNQDPIKLHEKFWHTRLICPGGGTYVWNDQLQTMESTVYGSPAAPKEGPAKLPLLDEFSFGDFGVTFQDDGLRARTELVRPKKKGVLAEAGTGKAPTR